MPDFTYFGGIDFSGAKEPLSNLWSAVGTERNGKLHVLALCPHPFRADLTACVAGGWRKSVSAAEGDRILWGADFPFGLPADASQRIAGERRPSWAGTAAWVADRPADEVRELFPEMHKRMRATDANGALAPLDMRLYRQTVEGIRCLHELRDTADVSILPVAPDASASTVLLEVYPSGTVRDLGIKGSKVPSRPGEVRARPAALRPYATFDHPSLEVIAVTLEDARDAVLACLTAFLCRGDLDQPARVSNRPAELVELEGWIYRAPDALGSASA
ncbi:MAG TPA: hypothetical protein VFE05_11850 [Longimicrobiaceae bacterium]|jgi:hypothetical protein|nr:hypothetical protein [Longimicrobiaceae bacterium]